MASDREACEDCRFFLEDPNKDTEGRCRYDPPKIFARPNDGQLRSMFPITQPWGWCGAFKLAKADAPEPPEPIEDHAALIAAVKVLAKKPSKAKVAKTTDNNG